MLAESIILLPESIVLSDCRGIRLGKNLLLLRNYSYCTGILVKAKAFVFERIGDVFDVFADVRRAEYILLFLTIIIKLYKIFRRRGGDFAFLCVTQHGCFNYNL